MAYSNYGYAPGGNVGSSLPRQVEYLGLKDYPSIQFTDQSQTSDNFFNVLEFPDKLTSGKNIIKLRVSAGTLVKNSKIHIEVLDFNGDPIYFEPLDYFEPDGTRVISIYVDDETVPGLARVYLASRIKANPNTGQSIPFSQDFNSPDYVNIPNIIWSRQLTVQPQSPNKTEIIFDPENPPQLTVSETRFPLFKPQPIASRTGYADPDPTIQNLPQNAMFAMPGAGTILSIRTEFTTFSKLFGSDESATTDAYTYFSRHDNHMQEFFPFPIDPIDAAAGTIPGVKFKANRAYFTPDMIRSVLRVQNAIVEPAGNQRFPFAISGSVSQSGEIFRDAVLMPRSQLFDSSTKPWLVGLSEDSMPVSWSHNGESLLELSQTYGDEFYAAFYWTGYNGVGQFTGQVGPNPVPQNIPSSDLLDQYDDFDVIDYEAANRVFQISGSSFFIITSIVNEKVAYGQFMPDPSYINSINELPLDVARKVPMGGFWFEAAEIDRDNRIANGPDKDDRWDPEIEIGNAETVLHLHAAAVNFTSSFLDYTYVPDDPSDPGEPAQPNESELNQSFADIFIKNLEPLSGDIHSIRTLYKPGGMFGDFMHAGDTRVEAQEVFYSTSSFEGNAVNGIHYRRPGFFKAGDVSSSVELRQWNTGQIQMTYANAFQNIVSTTFTADSSGRNYALSASLSDTNLLSGVTLKTIDNIAYGDATHYGAQLETFGRFVYTGGKGAENGWNKHLLYFEADTTYELSFKAYSTNLIENTHEPNIRVPRLDVYIHDFQHNYLSTIQATTITVPDTQTDKYRYDLNIAYNDTFIYEDNILQPFLNWQPPADYSERHGQHIIAVEGYESSSLDVSAIFQANADFRGVPSFIIRRGEWTISEISIKTVKETGYTPNTTRVRLKVPTEHRNTPLSFKFQYLNYLGEPADLQSTIAPITFTGSNFLLSGEDNLLTGSLFISNTVGSGLEFAGASSGFLRSIGYTGFTSASRTDQPGGFLMYSGSVLPESPDSYNGVGLELVRDSSSFFQFHTSGSNAGLQVQTDRFFLGSETSQFISGSGGNIEISSSNFRLSPEGNVTASNMLLANIARGDSFEFKELTIDNDNSGSFLTTFVDDSKTYYNLNLDAANAMFIRLDDSLLYPIGKITPASTTGYAHQVFIESAITEGHYFANTGTSSLVEIKIDAGEHLAESFQTRTVNGVSYPDVMKIDVGARALLVRGSEEWKIQSLNDYKGVTASFGAIHFDDGTSITSTNLDGGAF